MTRPIGGYFELELSRGEEYHRNAIRLNTGRNCLEYILRVRRYKKVFLPYYTCEVILEPFHKLNIDYEFYHIDINLEIRDKISLKEDDALLYVNYFGLKQSFVEHLAERYGNKLIVDNTQAFFANPIKGIDTFYTCRKFLGVPDGAYLYIDKHLDEDFEQDVSYERMASLTKRVDLGAELGYDDFRKISASFIGQSIKRMSNLTQRILQSIDYEKVVEQRRANYVFLHATLVKSNNLNLPLEIDAVPMVYPYLTDENELKKQLIAEKVFVATYWPNVYNWCNPEDWEYILTEKTVFIPIDQRYNFDDMNDIKTIITK